MGKAVPLLRTTTTAAATPAHSTLCSSSSSTCSGTNRLRCRRRRKRPHSRRRADIAALWHALQRLQGHAYALSEVVRIRTGERGSAAL